MVEAEYAGCRLRAPPGPPPTAAAAAGATGDARPVLAVRHSSHGSHEPLASKDAVGESTMVEVEGLVPGAGAMWCRPPGPRVPEESVRTHQIAAAALMTR